MQSSDNDVRRKRNIWRTILIIVALIFVYAYAVQATQINLEEPLEPQRQENLVGLIRELAHPAFFSFRNETRSTNISIRMPCPEEIKGSQVTAEGRQIVLAPNCATTTQDPLTLTGTGFPANVRGAILWYPAGSETTRRLSEFRADDEGNFSVRFTMPDIRETEDPQRIEVVEILSRRLTGLSDASIVTINRIIETVLMALMASTIGTILAIPLSFLAARNLMANVGSPVAALMAGLIAAPFGAWVLYQLGALVVAASVFTAVQPWLGLGAAVILLVATVVLLRRGLDNNLVLVAAVVTGSLALAFWAQLGLISGAWLRDVLGFFGFVGNFINVLSDFVIVLLPLTFGFVGALVAASYGSRWGQELVLRMETGAARTITAVLTLLGVAMLLFGILWFIDWLCVFQVCNAIPAGSLWLALTVPALVVGAVAALFSLRQEPKRPFPIGIITYTLIRGTLNALRSIEPIIMGFVLVVWVGLGPFAGVMALMLHSIADLGKLFSEQVENIAEGPLEAVTATGANRIQTIVYAVIPQVVPNYIAFAFYRWDINVRMSTIIGFVGGGGIGFVLFRNTNLTQYREASVMVIAIAVVVSSLDYFSSRFRRRII